MKKRVKKLALLLWLALAILAGYFTLRSSTRQDYAALLEIPPCFRIGGPWHHFFEPGCKGALKNGVVYEINSDGLRERERKLVGQGAVMVLGDSMVEGKSIPFSDTLSQQLEQKTKRKFVNAGVRSRGPVIESLQLAALIDSYKPSFLLWVLNENDAGDDRLAYAMAQERDVNGVPTRIGTDDFAAVSGIGSMRDKFGNLFGLLDMLLHSTYKDAVLQLQNKENTGYQACAGLLRGIQLAKQYKLPRLFVLTPFGSAESGQEQAKEFAQLLPCLDGEETIDLRDELRKSEDFYLPGDTHWNAKGVGTVADILSLMRKF